MRDLLSDDKLKGLLEEAIGAAYGEDPSHFEKKGIEQAMVFRVGVFVVLDKDIGNVKYEYFKNGQNTPNPVP